MTSLFDVCDVITGAARQGNGLVPKNHVLTEPEICGSHVDCQLMGLEPAFPDLLFLIRPLQGWSLMCLHIKRTVLVTSEFPPFVLSKHFS